MSLFIEISLIILLYIDSETGLLQGKENDKNYHICAVHDPLLDEEAVAQKEQSCENNDILPSERENSMDRDFINDDITDEAGTESENSQESQNANEGLASALENSMDRDFIKYDKKDKAGTESESENSQEGQSANDTESESEYSQESQSAKKSRMLGEIINDLQRNTSQVST